MQLDRSIGPKNSKRDTFRNSKKELRKMAVSTPTTINGFTPQWLTQELQRSGTISAETTVTGVESEILGQGEGFMGIIGKLSLTYDGPAGPASLIAKIPTDNEKNRAIGRAIGVYEREVRVYSELLAKLDVPSPTVYAAIYEADGNEPKQRDIMKKADKLPMFLLKWLVTKEQGKSDVPPSVLVIEDLSHLDVGDQVAGGDPERIAQGLKTLAKLHAATWNLKGLPKTHWLEGPDTHPKSVHALHLNGRESFLKATKGKLSAHSIALFNSLEKTGVELYDHNRLNVPQVLNHGDYRLDNMFFGADGEVAAVFDWQASVPGPAPMDVAYFVTSSLHADTTDAEVEALLRGYHDELIAEGVTDYSFDQFMFDYHSSQLLNLSRMPGLTEGIDLGDERGTELLNVWLERLDAQLARVPAP